MGPVKIVRAEIFRYQLALRRPVQIRMYRNVAHPGYLLCVTDDHGAKGWGDISPLMGLSRESLAEAEANLKDVSARMRGHVLPEDIGLLETLDPVLAHALPSVRCGCEMAALNLAAAVRGVPLCKLWTERDVPAIKIASLLSGSTDVVVREASDARANSATCAKLKVGSLPLDEDIDRVRRVHEALGPDIRIRLDANRAWRLHEAVHFALGVKHLPVDYVEEPVDMPFNIPAFFKETGMAVALDETLTDTPFSTWEKFEGVKAIVVKPTLLGGFRKVAKLAAQAMRSNLVVVTSAVYESGVGIMALAHAAAAWGGPDVPAGLDTYRIIDWDVLAPRLPMEAGTLALGTLNTKVHAVDKGTLLSV
jgi:o-succinylbenzoate synthase